jgi:hypothetical protein
VSTLVSLGIAAFAVDRHGERSEEIDAAPAVLGASVVKPLLVWVGAGLEPFVSDSRQWEAIGRPAVTVSDNEATAVLWSRTGGEHLLAELAARTGVFWSPAGDGEHPSLRLMVTAAELAAAYARLASDQTRSAVLVRRWMREVPNDQTFDLRPVAAAAAGCPERSIGVKCGWFSLERAHAVVLTELEQRTLGAVVTTVHRPDESRKAMAQELSGNASRLALAHNGLAGSAIRDGTRRALERAAEL